MNEIYKPSELFIDNMVRGYLINSSSMSENEKHVELRRLILTMYEVVGVEVVSQGFSWNDKEEKQA